MRSIKALALAFVVSFGLTLGFAGCGDDDDSATGSCMSACKKCSGGASSECSEACEDAEGSGKCNSAHAAFYQCVGSHSCNPSNCEKEAAAIATCEMGGGGNASSACIDDCEECGGSYCSIVCAPPGTSEACADAMTDLFACYAGNGCDETNCGEEEDAADTLCQ